jgi:hypothetical protein
VNYEAPHHEAFSSLLLLPLSKVQVLSFLLVQTNGELCSVAGEGGGEQATTGVHSFPDPENENVKRLL